MGGYNTINAHDADCRYPSFMGLNQYGNETSMSDPRFAVEEKNVETFNGTMQPCAKNVRVNVASLNSPIETLAVLYRRWYFPNGLNPETPELMIAASGGHLYCAALNSAQWHQLTYAGEGDSPEPFASNEWSYVSYEINPVGAQFPIDVMLMSNARDGMVMINGFTRTYTVVETPKKFGVIERHAERIWGGAIASDPDMLVYSAPYDPTDWEQNEEIPEDGAGDILQPSWDGDSFTALKTFGSQLIAFKKTRVWRVMGTDPGEYVFKEQYGGGAPYPGTIAVDTERILAITDEGPVYYNGSTVDKFYATYVEGIFKRVNKAAMAKACACMWHGKYYVALPIDGSTVNNCVLIYNTVEGTWLFRDDVCVESFVPCESELLYTPIIEGSAYDVYRWRENSWELKECTAAPTKWVTPWNELGYKQIKKGPFDVYFLCEAYQDPVDLTISIQTDKKTMSKRVRIYPEKNPAGQQKQKHIHFPGFCRRFRLIIESAPGSPPWRIVNGMMVVPEIERD